MATQGEMPVKAGHDPVSAVLKWVLLGVAVGSFALFAWATVLTYERAAPQPERFVTGAGHTLMSGDDILAGKAGFQKADLMDYGSLYGMGSYFGEDYTAFALMRLARLTEDNLAHARFGSTFAALPADRQAAVRDAMRQQLQGLDLTQQQVVVPEALAAAMATLRDDLATNLRKVDETTGWTPAYSLDPSEAAHTAEFLVFSGLTTVARRPDTSWSWTENWPYEPEVGNTPTTNTFVWTWASFCFTFFAFGGVLFIYQRYLRRSGGRWTAKPNQTPGSDPHDKIGTEPARASDPSGARRPSRRRGVPRDGGGGPAGARRRHQTKRPRPPDRAHPRRGHHRWQEPAQGL